MLAFFSPPVILSVVAVSFSLLLCKEQSALHTLSYYSMVKKSVKWIFAKIFDSRFFAKCLAMLF
jgi:hypothetical protein